MMRGWVRWGVVDLQQGVGGGTGDGYYLVVSASAFFFTCAFVLCSLMFSVPFLSD